MCVEQIIRDITKDLNGVLNIADDLLVYGATIEEHDRNLEALLNRCRDVNLTLNLKNSDSSLIVYPFLVT